MLPSRLFFDDSFFKGDESIKSDIYEKDGNIVLIRDVLSDIKPYYLKIFTPKTIDKVGATE